MSSLASLKDVLSTAAVHFSDARPFLPMYTHLILSSLFPIYTGAHASLSRPSSAAKPEKKDKSTDDEDEDKVQKMEGMSNKDAIILPITAGLVLAGLYFLIMRYGADMINLIMGWYFAAVGVYSVGQLVNDALKLVISFICPDYYAASGSLWKVSTGERKAVRQDDETQTTDMPLPPLLNALPLPRSLKAALWSSCRLAKQKYTLKAYVKSFLELRANITAVSTISAAIGFGTIVYVNTVAKPWFLTNLQGFAVSYSALQLMSPTTFATGSLVLGALFCYDIWAVFFTPLMVTVAKNLDQPIKMVFPRPDEPSATPGEPPVKSFSMLGLGDIVLPGIMIGLALRFDLYMYYMKKQTKAQKVVAGSDGDKTAQEVMEKAPYISPTGRWGDRFWTYTLPVESLPSQLRSSFPKRYFAASMIGYVVGMLMTLGVMSVFQHAQPALLYLVPGVLISLWGTAVVRGEFKEMWNFTEALNGEQLEESKESEGSNQAKAGQKHLGLFERLWQELWSNSDQAKDKLKSKTKPEEGDGEGQQKSISIEQEGTKQEKDNSEGAEARDEGLIFALSITRFEANTKASVKDPSTTASAVTEKMDDGDT